MAVQHTPPHPGTVLQDDILPALGLSVTEGARQLGQRVYVRDGQRVIGFDNERGKGDHLHLEGDETAYAFNDTGTLIQDFLKLLRKYRIS